MEPVHEREWKQPYLKNARKCSGVNAFRTRHPHSPCPDSPQSRIDCIAVNPFDICVSPIPAQHAQENSVHHLGCSAATVPLATQRAVAQKFRPPRRKRFRSSFALPPSAEADVSNLSPIDFFPAAKLFTIDGEGPLPGAPSTDR